MILEEYESKYGCIIVINHSINKGSLHARLTGLKEVTGDYVLFVDSDDELMLDACEVISEFISQNGVFDIIHFNTKVCSKDPATVDFYQNFTKPLGIKLIGEQIPYNFFLEGNIESFLWNKCYSYSIFEKLFAMHMPLQITMAEDYFLTSYIMLNSKSYASINNQLYKYYYGDGVSGINPITSIDKWGNMVYSTYSVLYYTQKLLIDSGLYGRYRKGFLREVARRLSWLCGDVKHRCSSEIKKECKKVLISENIYYKSYLLDL